MLTRLRTWLKADDATAAIEAAILFPVLVSILLGSVDIGTGLLLNEKVVNSANMIADLLSREDDVSDADFNDAIVGGQLVIEPYDKTPLGYDVVGIQFLHTQKTPTVEWRDTDNMEPNADVLTRAAGLGDQNEGVIAVTVHYDYKPYFTAFVVGDIDMKELCFARGRSGAFVTRSD